jgi:hypothetical protein
MIRQNVPTRMIDVTRLVRSALPSRLSHRADESQGCRSGKIQPIALRRP